MAASQQRTGLGSCLCRTSVINTHDTETDTDTDMPLKKQPKTLEKLGLSAVQRVVTKVVQNVSEKGSEKFYMQKIATAAEFIEVDKAIENLQDLFFVYTSHYFHKDISQEILAALSSLCKNQVRNERSSSYPHQTLEERRKSWLKEQIILRFSTLLCHQAVHHLILHNDLEPSLVQAVCGAVPDIPSLQSLDLGSWQCRKYGLLSQPSHQDGYSLVFTKNLTDLSVSDVSLDFIICISNFCINLEKLAIYKSEVIY